MISYSVSYGQAIPPPPPGLPPVSIDGGLIYLLIGGLIFGVYKIKKNH